MKPPKVPGRLLAWTALLVALAASVSANVAFAHPSWGPRLSAGVAPLLVVLAAGLLERVPLAGIKPWRRLLAYGGLGVVVVAAFVTSFEHQYNLLIEYGNPALSAVLLPVAVDGLIVLASVCLTVIAERRRELNSDVRCDIAIQSATVELAKGISTVAPSPKRAVAKKSAKATRRPVAETRELLANLRIEQPGISQAEAARILGLSATRVREIDRSSPWYELLNDPERVNGSPVPVVEGASA